MSVIRVENLGKKYVIGRRRQTTPVAGLPSMREALTAGAKATLVKLRRSSMTGADQSGNQEFWAIKDLNFEIEYGDRVGVIGPNGAGKSTLLKVLSRITTPTTGRIEIEGRIASLLEVGTGFHPELSGRENIFLNGAILGMSRAEILRRFDEIVSFSEISEFLDTPVKRYSSGMYVRLAFAVAAHLEAEILVVDEVLAVGDAAFQKRCLGRMRDISHEGRTVLFVSHNMDAIGALCSRGILLDSGCIRADTSAGQAIHEYFKAMPGSTEYLRTTAPNDTCFLKRAFLARDGIHSTMVRSGDRLSLIAEVEAVRPMKISFEIILRDAAYRPLLFGPLGLAESCHHQLPVGVSRAELCFDLPFLANGEYSLDILIVDAGKQVYDNNENALKFQIDHAYVSESGWSFRQGRGQGSVLIPGESRILESDPK